jgi:hypothetical protein
MHYVDGLQFAVPVDWEVSGGARHEFTIGFVYWLGRCPPDPDSVPAKLTAYPADYTPVPIVGCEGRGTNQEPSANGPRTWSIDLPKASVTSAR